ncbi:hypothetical protein NHJ6243_002910 [Beauveria neobassiana]
MSSLDLLVIIDRVLPACYQKLLRIEKPDVLWQSVGIALLEFTRPLAIVLSEMKYSVDLTVTLTHKHFAIESFRDAITFASQYNDNIMLGLYRRA